MPAGPALRVTREADHTEREDVGLLDRLVSAIGEAATGLGVRADPAPVEADARRLLAEPLALYEAHARWPSRLTGSGFPVELSVKVDGSGRAALRYVVDVADHRRGPEDNWARYLHYAGLVTAPAGTSDGELWDLCRRGLGGVPPSFPSRLMHGVGYAPADRTRGSLYFRTGWLGAEELAARFPDESAAVAEAETRHGAGRGRRVEVIGYDFAPGSAPRPKVYVWPVVDGAAPAQGIVGRHPDLEPARDLFDAFRADVRDGDAEHALLLQTAVEPGGVAQRLFFSTAAWGWSGPAGLDRLTTHLGDRTGIARAPLATLTDAAAGYGFALDVAMVAVGNETSGPSATFYAWPRPVAAPRARPARPPAPAAAAGETPLAALVERGAAFLAASREADGSWNDYPPPGVDGLDGLVTAVVAAHLRSAPVPGLDLAPTRRWLADRYEPGAGWRPGPGGAPDTETTALALQALAWAPPPAPPPAAGEVLRRARVADGSFAPWVPSVPGAEEGDHEGAGTGEGPPEITAAAVAALLAAEPDNVGATVSGLVRLVAAQGPDGGWDGWWWTGRFLATARATTALAAFTTSALGTSPFGQGVLRTVERGLGGARAFLAAAAVPPDPWSLATWLAAWAGAGGDPAEPSVDRVVAALAAGQQPDGRWLGSPTRRVARPAATGPVPGREVLVDARCIVTTATVVGALAALAQRRDGTRP